MSIDIETARRVAKLARIKVEDEDLPALAEDFNRILGFVEQLNEVDVEGVEPMTSVTPISHARPQLRSGMTRYGMSELEVDEGIARTLGDDDEEQHDAER